jgi:hypothetical protein
VWPTPASRHVATRSLFVLSSTLNGDAVVWILVVRYSAEARISDPNSFAGQNTFPIHSGIVVNGIRLNSTSASSCIASLPHPRTLPNCFILHCLIIQCLILHCLIASSSIASSSNASLPHRPLLQCLILHCLIYQMSKQRWRIRQSIDYIVPHRLLVDNPCGGHPLDAF